MPLTAVVIGVISAFPVFDERIDQLQDFIFVNFVPAAGDVVQQYIDQFVERSAELTGAGSLFLVAAAILLMGTIEKSLNRIWRVDRPRSPTGRLRVYWAGVTRGALLMVASLGMTSYLAALQFGPEVVRSWLQALLLALTPFVVALLAFTLLFTAVPNRRVKIRHALVGATLSAVAFELSKHGFVLYLSNFPTYEKLYGALAAIPIFLVWIFVTWVVILLGASVSASLTTFNYRRADWRWNPRHHLLLIMRLIDHLASAQRAGRGRSSADLLALEEAATDDELQVLLDRLDEAGFIQRDEGGDWFLSADLAEVTLGDLYRDVPLVLPVAESMPIPEPSDGDRRLRAALNEIAEAAGPVLDRSLKSLLAERTTSSNGS